MSDAFKDQLEEYLDVTINVTDARYLLEAITDYGVDLAAEEGAEVFNQLSTALDTAQGEVHSGAAKATYLIVKIVPDSELVHESEPDDDDDETEEEKE